MPEKGKILTVLQVQENQKWQKKHDFMLKILSQYIKDDLLNYFEKLTNKAAKTINKKILKR